MTLDKELLMSVQYDLPLSEQPFVDLAENLERDPVDVIEKLRVYREKGYVKRIGAIVNYKAFGVIRKACLIAFACDESDVWRIAKIINDSVPDLSLKHNFWRDHERYRVWFTLKDRSVDAIRQTVERLAKACGVEDYLILPSKRVYKMDVKYDLYRGISWSDGVVRETQYNVEDLGLNAKMLLDLQSVDVLERPFKVFESYGYSELEIVDLIDEMIKKGIFRDFYGVLNEKRVGFKENCMNTVKTDKPRDVAKKLLRYRQITHLVEREVPENWDYPIYFMVHAVKKDPIESIRNEVIEFDGVVDAVTVYSKKNLRED
jgi:DNA-binding Lrp family transcriptional regulator